MSKEASVGFHAIERLIVKAPQGGLGALEDEARGSQATNLFTEGFGNFGGILKSASYAA